MDEINKLTVEMQFSTFLDTFWPEPPTKTPRYKSKSDQPFYSAVRGLEEGTGSCAGRLAHLVQKFKLWPGHKLSLCSSDPEAFDWAYVEPLKDGWPCWARPRVLFRFCDIDPRHDTLPTGFDSARETREEGALRTALWRDICTQVQRHFTFQQLTALYIVLVRGDFIFRITRWDRTGSVATEWVACKQEPGLLAMLFRRASVLSDEQLGFDAAASPVLPGSPEHEVMERAARPRADDFECDPGTVVYGEMEDPARAFKFARAEYRWTLACSPLLGGGQPRWKLSIPSPNTKSPPHDFLVGAPLKYEKGELFDWRNARGYLAVDCRTEAFVFLKDTWRELDRQPGGLSEGDCLAQLNAAGVPHVPTLVCHADLEDTKTPVPDFDVADTEGGKLTRRRHYRIAVKEFCLPLARILSGRQFVSAVKDCISAHAAAAKLVEVLHGDLSYSNLMICPKIYKRRKSAKPLVKWEGILIDWEGAQPLPNPSDCHMSGPGPDSRMTWQFASVPYIHDRTRQLEIADELESFFYILLYGTVRFLHSTLPPSRVELFLNGFFDHDYIDDVGWAASTWKRYAFEHARIFTPPHGDPLCFLGCPHSPGSDECGGNLARGGSDTPLNSLMDEMLSWFHGRFVVRFGPGGTVLDERHFVQMEHPLDIPKDPRLSQLDVKTLADKLVDHGATLALLERKLSEHWPEGDFAGDRLIDKPSKLLPLLAFPEEEELPPQPEPRQRDSIQTFTRQEEEEVLMMLLPRKMNARKSAQRRPITKLKTKVKTNARPLVVDAEIAAAANTPPTAPRRSKRLQKEPPSEGLEENWNRHPKRQCRR